MIGQEYENTGTSRTPIQQKLDNLYSISRIETPSPVRSHFWSRTLTRMGLAVALLGTPTAAAWAFNQTSGGIPSQPIRPVFDTSCGGTTPQTKYEEVKVANTPKTLQYHEGGLYLVDSEGQALNFDAYSPDATPGKDVDIMIGSQAFPDGISLQLRDGIVSLDNLNKAPLVGEIFVTPLQDCP